MRANLEPGLSAVASLLFAMSLALSGDGETLAVGVRLDDGGSSGVNCDQSDNSVRDSDAVFVHRLPLN